MQHKVSFVVSLTSVASPSSWQKLDLLALSLMTVTSRRVGTAGGGGGGGGVCPEEATFLSRRSDPSCLQTLLSFPVDAVSSARGSFFFLSRKAARLRVCVTMQMQMIGWAMLFKKAKVKAKSNFCVDSGVTWRSIKF